MSPRTHTALVASGIAAVCLLLAGLVSRGLGREVPLGEVQRGDLPLTVPVTGTLEAVDDSSLGPPTVADKWDFKIAFMVPEGKRVKAGESVLRFDSSDLERELAQRRNEAESARQEIAKKEADLEVEQERRELARAEATARQRKASLKVDIPADLLAGREMAKARNDAALADREVEFRRGQVEALERRRAAELAALRHRLERAELRVVELSDAVEAVNVKAPRDGTVVYLANWRGEKKKIGDPSWRSDKVMSVPDLSRLRAQAEVDEGDAGRLASGQPLRFRLDAHPDVELRATVSAVGKTVQRASPTSPLKVARAEVALERVDVELMRPGMRFRGEIEVDRVVGALLLPVVALVDTPEGARVFRRGLTGFVEVAPRLGRRGSRQVEVLGGLEAGDQVALADPRSGEKR